MIEPAVVQHERLHDNVSPQFASVQDLYTLGGYVALYGALDLHIVRGNCGYDLGLLADDQVAGDVDRAAEISIHTHAAAAAEVALKAGIGSNYRLDLDGRAGRDSWLRLGSPFSTTK
jgi:hypothetical protein